MEVHGIGLVRYTLKGLFCWTHQTDHLFRVIGWEAIRHSLYANRRHVLRASVSFTFR
jgi:hypothetical protein